MTGHDDSTINIVVVIIIIIIFYYVAHQHKAAGRKTRLDIQNYGCNGNLLCYHGVIIIIMQRLLRCVLYFGIACPYLLYWLKTFKYSKSY